MVNAGTLELYVETKINKSDIEKKAEEAAKMFEKKFNKSMSSLGLSKTVVGKGEGKGGLTKQMDKSLDKIALKMLGIDILIKWTKKIWKTLEKYSPFISALGTMFNAAMKLLLLPLGEAIFNALFPILEAFLNFSDWMSKGSVPKGVVPGAAKDVIPVTKETTIKAEKIAEKSSQYIEDQFGREKLFPKIKTNFGELMEKYGPPDKKILRDTSEGELIKRGEILKETPKYTTPEKSIFSEIIRKYTKPLGEFLELMKPRAMEIPGAIGKGPMEYGPPLMTILPGQDTGRMVNPLDISNYVVAFEDILDYIKGKEVTPRTVEAGYLVELKITTEKGTSITPIVVPKNVTIISNQTRGTT